MDYVIKNDRNLYIRLNKQGLPVACGQSNKGLFTNDKARNIVDNLPKHLKKLRFKVEAIPDTVKPKVVETPKVLVKDAYEQAIGISSWLNKFGEYSKTIDEAKSRKEDLLLSLSNVDRKLSNELHKIELEAWKNACSGYFEYKEIKHITEERRKIKDELFILNCILDTDCKNLTLNKLDTLSNKLASRKFVYRIVEDESDEM